MDRWFGDGTNSSENIEVMWEGRDNLWNLLPSGDYNVKIQLCHSSYWDESYLGVSNTGLKISISSSIGGLYGWVKYLLSGSTTAVEGAKVEAGTYDDYAEAYTNSSGYFFISGVEKERDYHIHVEKPGYDPQDIPAVHYCTTDSSKQVVGSGPAQGIILSKGGKLSGTVTLPSAFAAYTDQWGTEINEIWGNVNVWEETTGNYGFTNFQIFSGQSSKAYEVSLPPGTYRVEVEMYGYSLQIATGVVVDSFGATKNFTVGAAQQNVKVTGTVRIPEADIGRYVYVNMSLNNDASMSYAYSGTEINASTSVPFIIHDVTPNTTYSLNLHADGYAEKFVSDVYVGTSDTAIGTYDFNEGGKIDGKIKIVGDLTVLSNNYFWINAWSPSTGHGAGTDITLPMSSTGTIQAFKITGLVDNADYYVDMWLDGYEMKDKPYIVTVPSTNAIIELVKFSGEIIGEVNGFSDYTKVMVTAMGGMLGDVIVSTVSASGAFSMTGFGTGEFMLSVNQFDTIPDFGNPLGVADGNYATLTKMVGVTNGATRDIGILTLSTSGSIAGTVHISTTATRTAYTDLDGEFVEVMPQQMNWMGMGDVYHQARLWATDIDKATFTVRGLSKGIYVVRPPTYLGSGNMAGNSKTKTVSSGQTTNVDLYLTDGYYITGSVQRPFTGFECLNVDLFNDGYSRESILGYHIDFSSTNRTANYNIGPVSPGDYLVKAFSENYKEEVKQVTVVDKDISVALIALSKGASIKGRLVDGKTGQPVSGKNGIQVICEARPWVEGSWRETSLWDEQRKIDETTGEFELSNLPAGTYIVRIGGQQEDNYGFAAQYSNYAGMMKAGINVPDNAEQIDLGTIKLKEGLTISGRVVDSQDKGIANIRMAAMPSSHHGESVFLNAKTDTGGYYAITGVDENIKYWEVTAAIRPEWQEGIVSGYGEKSKYNVKVPEDSEDVDFKLSAANARASGTVNPPGAEELALPWDDMGKDMPGALVLLQEKGRIYDDPTGGIRQVTDHDGSFVVEGIVAKDYVLKVFSKGLQTYISDITIYNGANNLGDFQLVKGKKVEGTIVDQFGKKLNKSDVHEVIAVTSDFTNFLFGSIDVNSTSNEIERYRVEGLKDDLEYYIALVGESKSDVFVDPTPVELSVGISSRTKAILYTDNPPQFIVQAERSAVNEDLFNIDVWSNEPLSERNASDIISVVEGNGTLSNHILSDDKRECSALYTAVSDDSFKILVSGHDLKGQSTTKHFTIYTGEKGRNEELVNPVTGGNIVIGQGDASGFYLPMGTRLTVDGEELTEITSLKILITSIDSEQIGAQGMKKGLSAYSFIVPSLAVKSYAAPGEMHSSIYNMEIYLVSGPLAQLAAGESAKVTIEYDLSGSTIPVSKLDINYYDETNGYWVKEKGNRTIDADNNTIAVDVSHFTKYAAFADETAPDVPVLSADKVSGGISLDWSKSSATDVSYYEIYQSSVEASGSSEGGYYTLLDTVTASGADVQTYIVSITTGPYFAVKAVDDATTPNKSGYSNQVTASYSGADYKMWVYPNPFHPTANNKLIIKYRIPSAAGNDLSIDIKIYNLVGELVKDDFSEATIDADGGSVKSVEWDGKNENGTYVADGVYHCYIKMGTSEIIKKVALLRSN